MLEGENNAWNGEDISCLEQNKQGLPPGKMLHVISFFWLSYFIFFFETQSHISQAGPPLAIYLKMTLNCLKPGALCVLVKNSTKWAISHAPGNIFKQVQLLSKNIFSNYNSSTIFGTTVVIYVDPFSPNSLVWDADFSTSEILYHGLAWWLSGHKDTKADLWNLYGRDNWFS